MGIVDLGVIAFNGNLTILSNLVSYTEQPFFMDGGDLSLWRGSTQRILSSFDRVV